MALTITMDKTIKDAITVAEWLRNPETTTHLRMALNIAGFGATDYGVTLLFRIMEALEKKGGDLTVHDIVDIQMATEREFREKNIPD